MIKVKAGELVGILTGLRSVLSENMPQTTAYKLCRLAKKVESELKDFEDNKIALIEKYGVKDPKSEVEDYLQDQITGGIRLKDRVAFNQEFKEMSAIELEFDFDIMPVSSLGIEKLKGEKLLYLADIIFTDTKT